MFAGPFQLYSLLLDNNYIGIRKYIRLIFISLQCGGHTAFASLTFTFCEYGRNVSGRRDIFACLVYRIHATHRPAPMPSGVNFTYSVFAICLNSSFRIIARLLRNFVFLFVEIRCIHCRFVSFQVSKISC